MTLERTKGPWSRHGKVIVNAEKSVASCLREEDAAYIVCFENAVPEVERALEAIADQLERIGDTRPHKDGQFIDDARAALALLKGGTP